MTREEFAKKFKVGDIITRPHWASRSWLNILYIGKDGFFAVDHHGAEGSWGIDEYWTIYEEPKPKLAPAAYLYKDGDWRITSFLFESKESAIDWLGRIGINSNIIWPARFDDEGFLIMPEGEE